jgi:hypothetical protein
MSWALGWAGGDQELAAEHLDRLAGTYDAVRSICAWGGGLCLSILPPEDLVSVALLAFCVGLGEDPLLLIISRGHDETWGTPKE